MPDHMHERAFESAIPLRLRKYDARPEPHRSVPHPHELDCILALQRVGGDSVEAAIVVEHVEQRKVVRH